MTLGFILGAFVRPRNLGMVGGEAIPVRVSPTQTRMPAPIKAPEQPAAVPADPAPTPDPVPQK